MGSSGNPLAAGERFGPYRIVAPLGNGGMSVLYRATDESLGRDVALKIMAPDLSEDAEFRARFTTEARLASHVDHPHIVPIYSFGEGDGDHPGQLYIAMRYVPGEDLRAVLRRVGRLEPAGVLAVLDPIARALDAVHRAGLVHRDVKPDNILVQWDDRGGIHPYLADFGLTRTGSGTGLTRTGQMLGTLAYAAPEQIRGEGMGPATDIYALGAVLYECLTGAKPFPRDNDGAVIYAHLSDSVPAVSSTVPELPRGLDAIVDRAMAKDAAERYPSAGAMFDDVQQALTADDGPAAIGDPAAVAAVPASVGCVAAPADIIGGPRGEDIDDGAAVVARARRRGWWIAAAALAVVLVAASAAALAKRDTAIDQQLADTQTPTTTTTSRVISGATGADPVQTGTTVTDPTATSVVETVDPVTGAPVTSIVRTAGNIPTGATPNVPTTQRSGTPTNGGQTAPTTTAGQPVGPTGPTSAPGPVPSASVRNASVESIASCDDPGSMTLDVSWTTPTSTGGAVDSYTVRVHKFVKPAGSETLSAADVATAATAGTSVRITVPRTDTPDSYYGYEVIAHNAKGDGPATRARSVVPRVLGLCSWTGWLALRSTGLLPIPLGAVNDASRNDIYEQSVSADTTVGSGTGVGVKTYCSPGNC